ncbi:MAG: ECF transporter S component [Muribaculaceae bacterium]|nr:ECF transporter S component [Muribaculaceae bacterium]
MNTATTKLYSMDYRQARTYVLATLFVLGNIALPQLCHLMPNGGHIWLPIYFFTLVAAYKYGWRVGLLTAVLSPVMNSLLFGMPAAAALPVILVKSVTLAAVAAMVARRTGRVTLAALVAVVLTHQVIGSLAECLIDGSWMAGLADWRMGIPGMLLQIVGGYAVLKYVLNK